MALIGKFAAYDLFNLWAYEWMVLTIDGGSLMGELHQRW